MNISERLKLILKAEMTTHKRFKTLEELTGISAESWRAFENDRQKPSADMVAWVSKLWPDYAFWLATGITEPEFRHVAPMTLEEKFPIIRGLFSEAASKERKLKIQMLESLPEENAECVQYLQAVRDQASIHLGTAGMKPIKSAYEKLISHFGIEKNQDFLMVEGNPELQSAREERWAQDKDLWLMVRNQRANIFTAKWLGKWAEQLTNIFTINKK